MRTTRVFVLLVLIVLAVLAVPAPAAAAKPCWKKLVNDWFDGRIDGTYPASCYRAAIKNLPDDVDAYSDAREDINRALLNAIRARDQAGGTLAPGDPVPPARKVTTETNPPPNDDEPDEETDTETVAGPSDDDPGLLDFKPANADSVPLPLLILAGLALVLLAAAGAGFVARRLKARRVRITPPGSTPP